MEAIVLERGDHQRVGKSFAVDAGARYLEQRPPEVVLVIDADCIPQEGAISHLARVARACDRPVQAAYLMRAPAGSHREIQLHEAMILPKNFVRPLGLHRLHLPCLLTGSGMAFPWRIFRTAPLASGNRVDDMQLTVDLATAAAAPYFCPAAQVRNVLSAKPDASGLQRSGWVEGHLRTIFAQLPRLLGFALRRRRLNLALLAIELSLPPLSILIMHPAIIELLGFGFGWFGRALGRLGALCYSPGQRALR